MKIHEMEVLKDENNYITKKMIRIDEFLEIYKRCKETEDEKDFEIIMIDNNDEIKIKFKYREIEISEVDYDLIDFEIEFLDKNYEYDEDGDCCCYREKINTILLYKEQKCRISFNQDGFWTGIIFDSSIASRIKPISKSYIERRQREYAEHNKKTIRVNELELIRDGDGYDSKEILDINKFFEINKSFPRFNYKRGYEFDITMKCQDTLVQNVFLYSLIQDEVSKDNKNITKNFKCESSDNIANFTFNKKQKCKVAFSSHMGGRCIGIRISDLDNKIYEQSKNSYSGNYNNLKEDNLERYDAIEYMRDNGYDPENDSFDDM